MNYYNYSISAGKGKLYLKEKSPKEGYEEIIYGSEGKKTYHKYSDSIKGTPKNLEVKEVNYDGKVLKFLELTLLDGEDSNKVSAPLKNAKGNYTDEVKAILSALNGLKLGEEVTFTTKATTTTGKNGKEYKNLNIYINYVNILGENGKGQGTGFIPYTDIPTPTEKTVAGDKVWDFSPQTEFYYSKLGEIIERFKSSTTPSQTSAPKSETPKKEEVSNDLPF